MINAILTALNEGAPNMLLTLLLISLLVIWLQSKLNKEFGSLREDIAKMDKDLCKEISEGNKELREEIGDVSKRLARIEGKLELPAYAAKVQPSAKTA